MTYKDMKDYINNNIINADMLQINFHVDTSTYLYLSGEKTSIRIPLTDLGLDSFANAWREIMKIPEASKILSKYKLLEDK